VEELIMQKSVIRFALGAFGLGIAAFGAPTGGAAAGDVDVSGFARVSMNRLEDQKAFVFSFEQVRLTAMDRPREDLEVKIQVDFLKAGTDKDGQTPAIIRDAVVTFRPRPTLAVAVGKFKTPLGMEFAMSPVDLDIVKRGLGQTLVFERNTGIMLQGRGLGKHGLGFALGAFNQGPQNANGIGDPEEGQDYTVAARASADPAPRLHLEAYAGSALTSVSGQSRVDLFGGGVKMQVLAGVWVKGEVMSRDDEGNAAVDGTDFYVQGSWRNSSRFEPVVKYERRDVKDPDADQSDVTLGLNFHLDPKRPRTARLQINAVLSDRDGDDALRAVFQGAF
jgi:hypothetical protein